ncbi:hypothetical protein FRC17_003065 [Serendipita sp. 399]|nr:hypothetical protein FRC17_003065 [Serendipita sp. 399]
MFAASFGPNPQLFIAKQEYMSSLNMHAFHDLWSVYWITGLLPESTAHDPAEVVGGASAVIAGMKQRAAYMPSLETHRGSYLMPTGSDIFSVYKYHSAVLTGARNGSIKLFDIRAPPSSHVTLFPPCVKSTPQRGWDSRGKQTNARSRVNASTSSNSHSETKTRHTSSVTNLHVIDDWGLLSSNTAANRELFRTHPDAGRNDSRSYINRGGPDSVVAFAGHVNSCSQGLGFYVAPSPGVVFAAGEDRKVRAWSLRTGEPIQPRAENNKGLLSHTFDRPVNAIVPAQEGQEIWVASGRYHKGIGLIDGRPSAE